MRLRNLVTKLGLGSAAALMGVLVLAPGALLGQALPHDLFNVNGSFAVDLGSGPQSAGFNGQIEILREPGQTAGTIETEIISMSLTGDVGGVSIEIREDPNHPSTGLLTPTGTAGNFDSFFDVFTEISVDGSTFGSSIFRLAGSFNQSDESFESHVAPETDILDSSGISNGTLEILGMFFERQPRAMTWSFPLQGIQEVPPVSPTAEGSCDVTVSGDHQAVELLCTHTVQRPSASHIHVAPAGSNGSIVLNLGDPTSPIDVRWDSTSDPALSPTHIAEMMAGNFYVNVHSLDVPSGELRGQILHEYQIDIGCDISIGGGSWGDPMPAHGAGSVSVATTDLNEDGTGTAAGLVTDLHCAGGDPDFGGFELRLGGNEFGLPSPGQTTLTRLGDGTFNVDSFFDITYEIQFPDLQEQFLTATSHQLAGTVGNWPPNDGDEVTSDSGPVPLVGQDGTSTQHTLDIPRIGFGPQGEPTNPCDDTTTGTVGLFFEQHHIGIPVDGSGVVNVVACEGANDLYGAQLELDFDSPAVGITGILPLHLLSGNGQPDVGGGYFHTWDPTAANAPVLLYAVTMLADAPPTNSPGRLVEIEVTCTQPGEFYLGITGQLLADADANEIPSEVLNYVDVWCGDPEQPEDPSFSVSADSTSTAAIAAKNSIAEDLVAASILGIDPAGGLPKVGISALDLGLQAGDDIDALSYGLTQVLFPPEDQQGRLPLMPVHFSVVPGSMGLSGSDLNLEATGCDPSTHVAGDEYAVNADASGILWGTNVQWLDEDGVDCGSGLAEYPFGLVPGDDVDALDFIHPRNIDTNPDGSPSQPVYFSLAPESPSLSSLPEVDLGTSTRPVSYADILVSLNGTVRVYAQAEWLGLHPDLDDLDALEMHEDSDIDFNPIYGLRDVDGNARTVSGDIVVFSVDLASSVVDVNGSFVDAGDLLVPAKRESDGEPRVRVAIAAADLGLHPEDAADQAADDLNALKGWAFVIWIGGEPPRPENPSFSIDADNPSTADIAGANSISADEVAASVLALNSDTGATPDVVFSASDLGLRGGDNIDALSWGISPIPGRNGDDGSSTAESLTSHGVGPAFVLPLMSLHFSVEPDSLGLSGSDLGEEALFCDPSRHVAADEYAVPADEGGIHWGTNIQWLDEDGVDCGSGLASYPFGLVPGDNVDGLDHANPWQYKDQEQSAPTEPLFFSLSPDSPSLSALTGILGMPVSPADVLVAYDIDLNGVIDPTATLSEIWVYAKAEELGLDAQEDNLDALELTEDWADGIGFSPALGQNIFDPATGLPTGDLLVFSVDSTSEAVTFIDPGDLLVPDFLGYRVGVPAFDLGLLDFLIGGIGGEDDLNALKGYATLAFTGGEPPEPQQPPEIPSFSVARDSASTSAIAAGNSITPADVAASILEMDLHDDNGGVPIVIYRPVDLGLQAGDDLISLSYGAGFFGTSPVSEEAGYGIDGVGSLDHFSPTGFLGPVHFSTEVNAAGRPGSGLHTEAANCDPATQIAGDEYAVDLPGNNRQFLDEDGVDCGSGQASFPFGLLPGDDVDALDNTPASWLNDTDPMFFTIDPSSPSLSTLPGVPVPGPTADRPLSSADVLVNYWDDGTNSRITKVFATAEELGLDPTGDVIDALEMFYDRGDPGSTIQRLPLFQRPSRENGILSGDVVLFSLRAGSTSLSINSFSQGDILTPNKDTAGGPPMLAWPARQSGLLESDDMNALKGQPEFLWRRAPHPDPIGTPDPSDCTVAPLNLYTSAWKQLAPLPIGREGGYATIIGGRIYVGHGNSVFGDDNFNYVYDPATNTWHSAASAPIGRAETTGVCAVDEDGQGKAYVIGGRDFNANGGFGGVLDHVIAYNPVADAWERKAPMPTERAGLGAATVPGLLNGGDAIFAIGGRDTTSPHTGSPLDVVEVYDVVNNTWLPAATAAPMPIPMMDIYSTVFVPGRGDDGSIFVIGGFGPDSSGRIDVSSAVQIYDVASNTWTAGPPMPTPRSNLLAGICGNQIHAIGGYNGFNEYDINEALDLSTLAWTAGWAKMVTPISEFMTQGIYTGAEIFAIGEGIFGQGGQEHAVYTCSADGGDDLEPNIVVRPQEVHVELPVAPGSVGDATGTVEIRNNGSATLNVTEIVQSDASGTPATAPWLSLLNVPTGNPILIMPPGNHFNLEVRVDCSATVVEHNTHHIKISSNDPDRPVGLLPVWLICNEPDGVPDIFVTPFPQHEQTHPTTGVTDGTVTVAVINESTATAGLVVSKVEEADGGRNVADIHFLDLSGLPTLPITLAPGAGFDFIATKDCAPNDDPLAEGTYFAHIKITSNDPDEDPVFIRIVLKCVEETQLVPDIDVDPTEISQTHVLPPNQPVSGSEDVKIRNLGDADLSVTAIEEWQTQSTQGDVSWLSLSNLPTLPLTLQTGQFHEFTVTKDCTGRDEGTYTAYIKITSNDPDEDPVWVSVELICRDIDVFMGLTPVNTGLEPVPDQSVGAEFSLFIKLESGTNPVDGAQAYVDFDAADLEVVSLTNAGGLSIQLTNTFDNNAGTLDFAAGTFSTPPAGNILLAEVTFKALQATEETCLAFGTTSPRESKATNSGAPYDVSHPGQCFALLVDSPVEVRPGTPDDADDNPLTTIIGVGSTFEADLYVAVEAGQDVDGAQAYVNFDPDIVQVVSITGSGLLNVVTQNVFDNQAGTLGFAAGTFGTALTGPFVLATVEFKVNEGLGATGELVDLPLDTLLTLQFQAPRETKVVLAGSVIPGEHQNGTVTVVSSRLVGQVEPQSPHATAPDSDWFSMELTVTFWEPGANPASDSPVETFTVTSDENGEFVVNGIPQGTYDIRVKERRTISNAATSVDTTSGQTSQDFGALRDGDVSGDNLVDIVDFSQLRLSFGKIEGDAAYNENANFNRDTVVDIVDFSRLRVNFGKLGD